MTPYLQEILREPNTGRYLELLDALYDNDHNIISGIVNRTGFELTPRSWTNFKGFHEEVQNRVKTRGSPEVLGGSRRFKVAGLAVVDTGGEDPHLGQPLSVVWDWRVTVVPPFESGLSEVEFSPMEETLHEEVPF